MSSTEDNFYSEAAYLVCLVLGRSCRIKTALYESSFTTDLRKLYALGCNTLSSYSSLSDILSTSGLLADSSGAAHLTISDDASSEACLQCSLSVLVHDLVLGSKRAVKHQVLIRQLALLTGDSHAFKKIRNAYHMTRKQAKAKLDDSSPRQQGRQDEIDSSIKLPYYARVNSLLTNLAEVVEELQSNGFSLRKHNPTADSYHRFLKRVRKLKPNQFMLDHHLPDKLLVFPVGTTLHQLDLYKSRRLIVQDKASCIPTEVLKPICTTDALDACAAPGNKTLQLVSALSPDCTLFVVDRDPARFRRLCSHLTSSGVQRLKTEGPVVTDLDSTTPANSNSPNQPRVEALCADFLALDPKDPRFARVQSILLDPSCSGSGLIQRQPDGTHWTTVENSKRISAKGDIADASRSEQPDQRLRRLANLQAQLLRHAFQFPNVERVVYSTCSVHTQENEHVVSELLERFSGQFELEPIWPDASVTGDETLDTYAPVWTNRGLEEFGCAACIRATPSEDLTNGFFVACFRRLHANPPRTDAQRRRRKRLSDTTYSHHEMVDAKRSHTIAQESSEERISTTTKKKKKKNKHKKHE